MKKAIIAMAATLAVVGSMATVFAQEAKTQGQEQAAPDQPRKTALYSGVVQEVDLKEKIVMVGKPKSELGMAFYSSEAKLVGYKKLKDIKRGDKVKVEYDAIKSRTFAVTITKEE